MVGGVSLGGRRNRAAAGPQALRSLVANQKRSGQLQGNTLFYGNWLALVPGDFALRYDGFRAFPAFPARRHHVARLRRESRLRTGSDEHAVDRTARHDALAKGPRGG